ncbi:MAG: alpha/beta hydrolase [Betaproteobacteria bacterium]|nr:alpha/beta hydrolase [Betaproteobacteria bacterium]
MTVPPLNPANLLSPEARRLIDNIHRAQRAPLHTLGVAQARAFYETGSSILDLPPAEVGRVEPLHLKARDGHRLAARLYAPAQVSHPPVLLYLHGGGFTLGSLATHDGLCRQLCLHGHCAVVSLDYRLAPEHRFPTAVYDAWDGLQDLKARGLSLGLDTSRLAVGGDSAGGTLACVCALMARDAGLPLRLQLLMYPGTTAHQDTDSHQRFGKGFLLDRETISWFFAQYIDVAQRTDWRFAPLRAQEHGGLAPAWVELAECDPLVDEGIDYADRLRAAGVQVDLEIYRGMIHGFVTMGRALAPARQAHQDAGLALQKALAGP